MKGRMEQVQKTAKQTTAPNKAHAAGRRPRRAAATSTKSYKEPDTDDSHSESEKPPGPKAKYFICIVSLSLFKIIVVYFKYC